MLSTKKTVLVPYSIASAVDFKGQNVRINTEDAHIGQYNICLKVILLIANILLNTILVIGNMY